MVNGKKKLLFQMLVLCSALNYAVADEDAAAVLKTGLQYYTGNGVPVDYKLAVTNFERAAALNNADAQAFLGCCYNNGTGVAQDTAKALAEGDMQKVFSNQQKANAAYEKKLRAEMVKSDPKPEGAGGGNEKPDTAVER